MDQKEFESVVEDSLCLPFINDFVRLVIGSYRQAHEECRSFAREVAHDHRGNRRRALIEQGIPAIAQRHKDQGVEACYRPTHNNTAFFAQVKMGRILFTQSCVETPETMVRKAEFRHTLARSFGPSLFDNGVIVPPTAPLYAIGIHGEGHHLREPYFLDIVFPDPECRVYVKRISLFNTCHALVDSLLNPAVQEEVVQDEAMPQLRPNEQRGDA